MEQHHYGTHVTTAQHFAPAVLAVLETTQLYLGDISLLGHLYLFSNNFCSSLPSVGLLPLEESSNHHHHTHAWGGCVWTLRAPVCTVNCLTWALRQRGRLKSNVGSLGALGVRLVLLRMRA